MKDHLRVIGGGLAGCEAAWQAAQRGIKVRLYEMKPVRYSPAHSSDLLGELVCSNSFKSSELSTATGLLKEEMRHCSSLILTCADENKVEAGGALAVDRKGFSESITRRIEEHPLIEVIHEETVSIDEDPDSPLIIATGPLTSDKMAEKISELTGSFLHFFDAAAPVIYGDSIDKNIAFYASRYDKGEAAYLNCPMTKAEYDAFYDALVTGECKEVEAFDELSLYEGCMPVESMARRGRQTLAFGPLKPVGIRHHVTGETFYAVVQLRKENEEGTLFNMVGFQTRLKFGEQKRIFSMIPGLASCEFARYGVMHRNTYIRSPGLLEPTYRMKDRNIYFAGQITGVEGYIESASSGLIAGINGARRMQGKEELIFPDTTAMGALARYVSSYPGKDFQPMGVNFGIISYAGDADPALKRIKDKTERRRIQSERSLAEMDLFIERENKG